MKRLMEVEFVLFLAVLVSVSLIGICIRKQARHIVVHVMSHEQQYCKQNENGENGEIQTVNTNDSSYLHNI